MGITRQSVHTKYNMESIMTIESVVPEVHHAWVIYLQASEEATTPSLATWPLGVRSGPLKRWPKSPTKSDDSADKIAEWVDRSSGVAA